MAIASPGQEWTPEDVSELATGRGTTGNRGNRPLFLLSTVNTTAPGPGTISTACDCVPSPRSTVASPEHGLAAIGTARAILARAERKE